MEKKENCVIWIMRMFHCIPKTDDNFKDIAEEVEARFDTPSYELDKPLL